ncbi:MAG: phosphoribosylformylglycinamidine synthase [Phycisphaerales bacterium]|nr:phosphoribosylformylglycinamidine synthase [Phycisphaerales bacterium]
MKPRTLILRTAGTNCDKETAHAFELAGATTESVHINRLLADPALIDRYQILAVPGGFSYGDDIAAGKILANQILHHLRDAFRAFVEAGKPVLGVCNGFQVLVKTDLLPGPAAGRTGQTATLAHNDSGRFVDRWVHVAPVAASRCVWTRDLPPVLELPVAHGEGKFVPADDAVRAQLWRDGRVALAYANSDGSPAAGRDPANPNGSAEDIAGVCDETGLVFGLMPHPERYVSPYQHFAWTRQKPLATEGQGLRVFQNAVRHVEQAVGIGV